MATDPEERMIWLIGPQAEALRRVCHPPGKKRHTWPGLVTW